MNNYNFLLNQVESRVTCFEKITLQEMEDVKLMNRVDVKYLIPLHLLPAILQDAQLHYKILEVNQDRICPYETLYYDTSDFSLYNNHQCGRTNRYKVRFRNYVNSNLSFFEIKFKNNKGRTIKTRIKQPTEASITLNDESADFLHQQTPLEASSLRGNLWVKYRRITLVSKTTAERLTIDLNLTFENENQSKNFDDVVIAEIKQEQLSGSPIVEILKQYQLREGSISKYCLGIMSIFSNVKFNNFKPKYLYLQKILNQNCHVRTSF
ncbi:MAG: polyphosphate polymerase domain-containing protein [Spirosomaceae bacterium]|jgi:hypothetical protein|nr:polyphosphate polymerase domain-containing protein [Spirosomataceae bacterium]